MPGKRNTNQARPKLLRRRVQAGQRTTAAKALQIAKAHLFQATTLDVYDSRTSNVPVYGCEACWLIFPHTDSIISVGASRAIAVSKKSGKVVFCGDVGE